ncbi:MAG: DUF2071 domain-containing protein [Planctomycetales bacterium]|nr:DUF2071 domain-containing protein [Planctomycetales bacterium]
MRIPIIRGLIERRVLVNYRVDPTVLAAMLPAPFRPQVVRGYGIAGICLIRLKQIRPKFLPGILGIASENAAHRIAVEWDAEDGTQCGVFIPRRDTSSRLNAWAGGRIFPGIHYRARFEVLESDSSMHVVMQSVDRAAHLRVVGRPASRMPDDSIFPSLDEVSRFFEAGSLGYSPRAVSGHYDRLELVTRQWNVEPFAVEHVESSLFDDRDRFPSGSIALDNALLMRNVEHQWRQGQPLCAGDYQVAPA